MTSSNARVKRMRVQPFNSDWKFSELVNNDRSSLQWRAINVPHDWSITKAFSKQLDGATGYLPGGEGLYRKTFTVDDFSDDEKILLNFDGIYNHARIAVNGHNLGEFPDGYVPITIDVAPYIEPDKPENVIEVLVDRRRYIDSRWYTGSGIYRDVSILRVPALSIVHNSDWTKTISLNGKRAEVVIECDIENSKENSKLVLVRVEILNAKKDVVFAKERPVTLPEHSSLNLKLTGQLDQVEAWSPENPVLYTQRIQIIEKNELQDQTEYYFGVRTFEFDKDDGFFLNNQPLKIKGVCLHHDGGLVGAAVTKNIWHRRLKKLKEAGVNAIRSAHNPASKVLLDVCDELGLLMQDELFDEWDYPKDKRLNMADEHGDFVSEGSASYFQQWGERNARTTVQARRRHACIFMWSIGNEIEWTYPRNREATGFFDATWDGNYFWSQPPNSPEQIKHKLKTLPHHRFDIGQTAQKISGWVKESDDSRVVTANCILPSASYLNGYAEALDVVGFSYRRVIYDYAHEHYPQWPIIGNENLAQWHDWKAVLERPFVSGLFLWTGIDYLGERHNAWPEKATASGLLDTAGFAKDQFHFFKTIWQEKPHSYFRTLPLEGSLYQYTDGKLTLVDPDSWEKRLWTWHDGYVHWNYTPGEMVVIEGMSNAETAELFLNGKSLGEQRLVDQPERLFKWCIPYAAGELTLISRTNGTVQSRYSVRSAGDIADIDLRLEDDLEFLSCNESQHIHVAAQLKDEDGHPVTHINSKISFSVTGHAEIVGMDNGRPDNVAGFQCDALETHRGQCLIVIQSAAGPQDIEITATLESGLERTLCLKKI